MSGDDFRDKEETQKLSTPVYDTYRYDANYVFKGLDVKEYYAYYS